jgi:N-acetylmuramoyl-L-alanine amidase
MLKTTLLASLLAFWIGAGGSAYANVASLVPKLPDRSFLELPKGTPKTARERECLAMAIYHEARGEALMGRVAVAQVIVNRVRSRAYPSTICRVVFQNAHLRNRCQFSFACDGVSDRPREIRAWRDADMLAREVLCASKCAASPRIPAVSLLSAPMRSATHYHATYVRPSWSRKKQSVGRIGTHVFYTSARVTRSM